jgi:hypothetical protein
MQHQQTADDTSTSDNILVGALLARPSGKFLQLSEDLGTTKHLKAYVHA